MGIEIERKFLIHKDKWSKARPFKSSAIRQAYIHSDPDKTIRLRVADEKGYLTIKGGKSEITRHEFEYEIPLKDANEMIDLLTTKVLEKTRHYVLHKEKIWEVDEFKGSNDGLWVAEIELTTAEENFDLPDWVDKEVSSDYRYSNSNLINNPYTNW